jgi:hypothetical protein
VAGPTPDRAFKEDWWSLTTIAPHQTCSFRRRPWLCECGFRCGLKLGVGEKKKKKKEVLVDLQ